MVCEGGHESIKGLRDDTRDMCRQDPACDKEPRNHAFTNNPISPQ